MKKATNLSGFKRGRIDGFKQGKENGFTQARTHILQHLSEKFIEEDQKLPKALVITSSIIASLEIGILQPFNELRDNEEMEYCLKFIHEVTKEDIAAATHIVFMRVVEPIAYQYLEWAHELGKKTIYFIDDNFMALDPGTDIGMYYLVPERLQTYIKFLKNSNFVKVDSAYFGEYIRKYFNSNVIYFPGSVDFNLLEQIEKPHKDDNQIVIGYEGGNKEKAFEPVVPALMQISDYFGGFVRLEFFGFTPSRLIGRPGVTSIESNPDYKEFIKKLYQCNWDIALAPLEDNQFSYCKTNNKFREYSACGIPGIYSNLPPYKDWVTHGESGYLVENTQDAWYKALFTMIEDKLLRKKIKDNVGKLAREHFNITSCAGEWKNQLLHKEETGDGQEQTF